MNSLKNIKVSSRFPNFEIDKRRKFMKKKLSKIGPFYLLSNSFLQEMLCFLTEK